MNAVVHALLDRRGEMKHAYGGVREFPADDVKVYLASIAGRRSVVDHDRFPLHEGVTHSGQTLVPCSQSVLVLQMALSDTRGKNQL